MGGFSRFVVTLPGQEGLHSNLCVAGPGQICPPLMAAGFVQVLVLFCTPLPHLALHSDQPDQEDHPPLTDRQHDKYEATMNVNLKEFRNLRQSDLNGYLF